MSNMWDTPEYKLNSFKHAQHSHYSDVSELVGVWNARHIAELKPNLSDPLDSYFKTEFTFAVAAPYNTSGYSEDETATTNLAELGFKKVSRMINWYPGHRGDNRVLTFYWRRSQEPKRATEFSLTRWGYRDPRIPLDQPAVTDYISKGGCGFMMTKPPFNKLMRQYFNLVRTPLSLTKMRERWLTHNNYRLLDVGSESQYWVNGWDSDKYSVTMELNYWTERKAAGEKDIFIP